MKSMKPENPTVRNILRLRRITEMRQDAEEELKKKEKQK